MIEIIINSIEELMKKIDKYDSSKIPKIEGQIRNYYFRGQANKEWDLIPNSLRNDEKNNFDELAELKKTKNELELMNISGDNESKVLLALAQHYGNKTRCLDFTRDYKVALYFACDPCSNDFNKDGALFIWEKDAHRPEWFTNYLVY